MLIKLKKETSKEQITWKENSYKYFAIGNSICMHGGADYWPVKTRGMAASKDEKDYVHLITNHLKTKYDNVDTKAINFATWEVTFTDRAQTICMIEPYLNSEIDLITVQLGENASELTNWQTDFEYLIKYIKEKCPKSKILVIGDFWEYKNRDELKEQAAKNTNVSFVSLKHIKDNKKYMAGLNSVIYYENDTKEHVIKHKGVAIHPGDLGMQEIANVVIKEIETF